MSRIAHKRYVLILVTKGYIEQSFIMSYPPPPGLKSSTPTPYTPPATHPSLPARPPPSSLPPAGFKPAYPSTTPSFGAAPGVGAGRGTGNASFSFQPRQVSAPAVSTAPVGFAPYQPPPQQYAQQPSYYDAPQIRNPFPLPGQPGAQGGYNNVDPEMEAQIAQWQSAYVKDPNDNSRGGVTRGRFGTGGEGFTSATSANAAPLGGKADVSTHAVSSAVNSDTGVATVVNGKDGKQATVVRSGGGSTWTDSSLLEWDPSHFRIFVGNLAGEVTDESLLKAFARWPSVQKARVVRDKRTTKSKGFGFVSFSDGDDFFQAAREMQGKYIGSHPVLIKRSTTEIKAVVPKDNRKGKYNKGKNGKGGGSGAGGHAKTDAGVHKPGSKTKGGLKVLG